MKVLVPGGSGRSVGAFAYSPDGGSLAVVGTIEERSFRSARLGLWHLPDDRLLFMKPLSAGPGRCVAFSPDGEHIAVGTGRDVVRICDATSGDTLHQLGGMTVTVVALAFSPDGTRLITGSADRGAMSRYGELFVWERPKYQRNERLALDAAYALGYSQDGSFFAVATGDGTIDLVGSPWDPRFEHHRLTRLIRDMAVSPDGRYLAAAVGHQVWLCDRETGMSLTRGKAPKPVNGVAFSPDSRRLAIASGDGVVRLWECGTWEERAAYEWGFTSTRCVAFSPDGLTCAAGGKGDVALVIWDVEG